MLKIKVDRMVGRWTNRGRHARKHGQYRAVNMAGCDQSHARMAFDDRRELAGVDEILAIHMPDACDKRRMMQEQQRGPVRVRCECRIEPLQRGRVELAMRLAGNAGIEQHEIEIAGLDLLME